MTTPRIPSLAITLCLLLIAPLTAADWNLHSVEGTMTECGCKFYEVISHAPCGAVDDRFAPCGDWICTATLLVADPAPHWTAQKPTPVDVELVEQAIGQCGAMQKNLPHRVDLLFWLEWAGIDHMHGDIVRSPIRGFYLFDLGPTE